MPEIDDVEVMAYADGELPAARADQIRAAAEHDANLRARIATFGASRRIVHGRFAQVLEQPVPAQLLQLIERAPGSARAQVLRVPARTAAAQPRRRTMRALLLAASLVAAFGLGLWLRPVAQPGAGGVIEVVLAGEALERKASGAPAIIATAGGAIEVLPLASYLADDGRYCRDFEVSVIAQPATSERVLACRASDGHWAPVTTLAAAPKGTPQEYVTASGSGHRLRRLNQAEEAAALVAGWRR